MALSAPKVLVGLADQSSTTGAVLTGDVMANIPEDFAAARTAIASLGSAGYVSPDGLSVSSDLSTTEIREWNGSVVRVVPGEATATASTVLIQTDYEGLCMVFGEENVERVAATAEHGEQIHVHVGAHLPKPRCFAFKMKDGAARMIVIVPNGQVSSSVELTFQAGEAIQLPLEVSCLDDGTGTGDLIHWYIDDGKAVS